MSGFDWAMIALGAAGAGGAFVAVAAAVNRHGRRRGSELPQRAARSPSRLREKRIEVVAIDNSKTTPEQKAHP